MPIQTNFYIFLLLTMLNIVILSILKIIINIYKKPHKPIDDIGFLSLLILFIY